MIGAGNDPGARAEASARPGRPRPGQHRRKWASVADILSSFRLVHGEYPAPDDYLRDIGIETDPGKAIGSDWEKVFGDLSRAFLQAAREMESRNARGVAGNGGARTRRQIDGKDAGV